MQLAFKSNNDDDNWKSRLRPFSNFSHLSYIMEKQVKHVLYRASELLFVLGIMCGYNWNFQLGTKPLGMEVRTSALALMTWHPSLHHLHFDQISGPFLPFMLYKQWATINNWYLHVPFHTLDCFTRGPSWLRAKCVLPVLQLCLWFLPQILSLWLIFCLKKQIPHKIGRSLKKKKNTFIGV